MTKTYLTYFNFRSKYSFLDNQYSIPKVIVEFKPLGEVLQITVDWVENKLYFARFNRIYQSDLDGKNQRQIFSVIYLRGLVVDPYER